MNSVKLKAETERKSKKIFGGNLLLDKNLPLSYHEQGGCWRVLEVTRVCSQQMIRVAKEFERKHVLTQQLNRLLASVFSAEKLSEIPMAEPFVKGIMQGSCLRSKGHKMRL